MGTQNVSRNVQVVKTCDLPKSAAVAAFVGLNEAEGKKLMTKTEGQSFYLEAIQDPAGMLYPSGWYFAKCHLRNKHNSTTGLYDQVRVVDITGHSWMTHAIETARQIQGKDFSAPVCAKVVAVLNGGELIDQAHVIVKPGKPIKVLDGWTVADACSLGFILSSGEKIVKVFFA